MEDHKHPDSCTMSLIVISVFVVWAIGAIFVCAGMYYDKGYTLWESVQAGVTWPLFLPFIVLEFIGEIDTSVGIPNR